MPIPEVSELAGWSPQQVTALLREADDHGTGLPDGWCSTLRSFAVGKMQRRDLPAPERLAWGHLALAVSARSAPTGGLGRLADRLHLNAYLIKHFGADRDDPDRAPDHVAANALAMLERPVSELKELAPRFYDLDPGEMLMLRRYQNVAAPLLTLAPLIEDEDLHGRLADLADLVALLP